MIAFEINFGVLKGGQCVSKKRVKHLLAAAEKILKLSPGRHELSIAFINVSAMKRLNEAYYGGKGVTDVLAFPSEGIEQARGYLGEILIHYPKAKKQSKEHGVSVKAEIELLLVHGLLHLLGYDHNTAKKKGTMFRLQDRILEAI